MPQVSSHNYNLLSLCHKAMSKALVKSALIVYHAGVHALADGGRASWDSCRHCVGGQYIAQALGTDECTGMESA